MPVGAQTAVELGLTVARYSPSLPAIKYATHRNALCARVASSGWLRANLSMRSVVVMSPGVCDDRELCLARLLVKCEGAQSVRFSIIEIKPGERHRTLSKRAETGLFQRCVWSAQTACLAISRSRNVILSGFIANDLRRDLLAIARTIAGRSGLWDFVIESPAMEFCK